MVASACSLGRISLVTFMFHGRSILEEKNTYHKLNCCVFHFHLLLLPFSFFAFKFHLLVLASLIDYSILTYWLSPFLLLHFFIHPLVLATFSLTCYSFSFLFTNSLFPFFSFSFFHSFTYLPFDFQVFHSSNFVRSLERLIQSSFLFLVFLTGVRVQKLIAFSIGIDVHSLHLVFDWSLLEIRP